MTRTPKALYTVLATAEMVTWTGLIAAMIARYGFGYEGSLFFVAGISHGTIFLAYCITAVVVGLNQRWAFGTIAIALLVAIPPYATLPFDRWLENATNSMAPGAWNTKATPEMTLASTDFSGFGFATLSGFFSRLPRAWPWFSQFCCCWVLPRNGEVADGRR
jgi:integral membrane protein